jgi:hypothetical protein
MSRRSSRLAAGQDCFKVSSSCSDRTSGAPDHRLQDVLRRFADTEETGLIGKPDSLTQGEKLVLLRFLPVLQKPWP